MLDLAIIVCVCVCVFNSDTLTSLRYLHYKQFSLASPFSLLSSPCGKDSGISLWDSRLLCPEVSRRVASTYRASQQACSIACYLVHRDVAVRLSSGVFVVYFTTLPVAQNV